MNLQNPIIEKISQLLELARNRVVVTVNQTMVLTYFEIGRTIVEEEQNGKNRAEYGKKLLKDLSIHLTEKFGRGFSEDNLLNMRNFYISYSGYSISETPSRKSIDGNSETPSRNLDKEVKTQISQTESVNFTLSWSHYIKLMRIKDINERKFYEIEAYKNNWSLREATKWLYQ